MVLGWQKDSWPRTTGNVAVMLMSVVISARGWRQEDQELKVIALGKGGLFDLSKLRP